ncbi:hypothetical protein Tco_0277503 [Tanacetum coccineum]
MEAMQRNLYGNMSYAGSKCLKQSPRKTTSSSQKAIMATTASLTYERKESVTQEKAKRMENEEREIMAPKRTTRSTPTTTTTTTPVTNAQLKALIDQGVVDALAARDVDRR